MSIVNRLHARFHRPERGWDPVPRDYARKYANTERKKVNQVLLDQLDEWTGGLRGKRVIDLGGGPGHYSAAFASRGSLVTWYDVSSQYRAIAEEMAVEHGVTILFKVGYLDEAASHFAAPFDLVFNRICWNYGMGDVSFSRAFFSLIRPGGAAYIDTNTSESRHGHLSRTARARYWLNDHLSTKIGHPFPPRGRLASLFAKKSIERMLVDYSSPSNDRIWIKRQMSADE